MRGLFTQPPLFLWDAILLGGAPHKKGDAYVEDSDAFDTACFLDNLAVHTPSYKS